MTRAWHNDETTEFLFTDVSGLTPHVLPGAPLSRPHLCGPIPSCDLPVADSSPLAGEPDTRRHKSCKLRAVACTGRVQAFQGISALLLVIHAGQRDGGGVPGTRPGWRSVAGSAGSGSVSGMLGGNHSRQASGGTAVTVRFSVTVRQVREDGSEAPLDGELAAALAAPAEQFAGLAAWAADEARFCDHGEREKVIGQEGRELQRRLLQATFDIDSAREERASGVTSAAGIPHGSVEEGHGRGLASVFGPVRVTRMAYRNRREPNLYPADARQVLPGDPYSLGMRSLAAFHLAGGGFGQAQEVIEARTGVTVGRAQLAGLAEDLAAWTGDFYEERSRDAEEEEQPDSDVIMMQGDGKGIAMRPEHRRNAGKEDGTRPGIKKMAEIVAVADFTPAVREPEDIAAPPARRQAHPGPEARDKWVSASITESIEDMIAAAFDEAGRRDPEHVRQRVFLVDGNKQQITAIEAQAAERGLKVPVLIDYIHVSGYLGKAAAALHPGDPATAGQWADGQLLRVLHGRAKAVAATLASVARKTRANPRKRDLDLTDLDRAVTYLTNNCKHMRYDKALEKGWPIATGMIEGACRFVIEDRFGITGARWSPDGAETILKLRAVVVNGDLDDYMNYYKNRYRDEHHLARYDEDTIDRLNLAA